MPDFYSAAQYLLFLVIAFRGDNPNATVQFLETGHFALETHLEEIASSMRVFLAR